LSVADLEKARRGAVTARRRLDTTLVSVQQRLRPANLAGEAWGGVKDKSADIADGALQAVRKRPAAVSVAVGAVALFLAREPIKRAVSRLLSDDGEQAEDGRIVTRIESDDAQFNLSSPIVTEGAS
jgi:hypothetical protein